MTFLRAARVLDIATNFIGLKSDAKYLAKPRCGEYPGGVDSLEKKV